MQVVYMFERRTCTEARERYVSEGANMLELNTEKEGCMSYTIKLT